MKNKSQRFFVREKSGWGASQQGRYSVGVLCFYSPALFLLKKGVKMEGKYDWIKSTAEKLVAERVPGVLTYRRCSREGGKFDNLSVIVKYTTRTGKDGRTLWVSQGEVIKLIPSYIGTGELGRGSVHNRDVRDYPV